MKVFLSSTAEDLSEYRKVADDTILRLSLESIAMERFGPRPGAAIDECERMARESDVVVCIVAHRYGSIPDGADASFTQREVEAAHKSGKKVLAWIVDDDYRWTETREQDLFLDPTVFGNSGREAEVKQRISKLLQFKTWLRKTVISESFTTPEDLGRKIAIALSQHFPREVPQPILQTEVSIARLPTTSANLFGREAEIKILNDAWAHPTTNIVSFVAWGGVGKTALVNHWLKQHMARDNYRGAERVYGWSFFSQGTTDRAASADLFIDQALRWFGDPDPTLGSPWDKGERLARYIRQSRTLLILDGLEPLQYPPGPQETRLKDAAMQALLIELAAHQPGLCVISTREQIGDLSEFQNATIIQHNLEHLSAEAGAQILRSFNVKGDQEELEDAARELAGHAFALTLLGSYLNEVLDGDIRRRREIENLFEDTRYGNAAQRMIEAYEKWLGEGIELAILRLLGLFDRPAPLSSLIALREPPLIAGLTEPLQRFKGREWNQAVARLRRIKLLAEASPDEPGTLDAHPLVREHFKQELKRKRPRIWREANKRLYEHLKYTTKEFPETVEEMSPLYAAVAHGCAATLYRDALSEVYYHRIQRRSLYFNKRQLGAMGTELAVLSGFFEIPFELPVRQLHDMEKGFVLNEAGMGLDSVGRLQEAARAIEAAYEIAAANDSPQGATAASNLGDLYLVLGDLSKALYFAEQSVELSARTGDEEEEISAQGTLARIWHQLGNIDQATTAFEKAEAVQKQYEPDRASLYSVSGFRYCDLLLDQGRIEEVKERAAHSRQALKENPDLLSDALDKLSMGRAQLKALERTQTHTSEQAADYLHSAVKGLRQAARITFLPLGLLGRAELYRFTHEFKNAERDLAEIQRISARNGMDLYLADYHLESARLQLAQDNRQKAHQHVATAKEMINRMGYHRRDKEVQELEAQLG